MSPGFTLVEFLLATSIVSFALADSALIRTFGIAALIAVAISYTAVAVVVPTLAAHSPTAAFLLSLNSTGIRLWASILSSARSANLFIAMMRASSALGVDLSGVIATSAVLTAVIGLSLQDTLGNAHPETH